MKNTTDNSKCIITALASAFAVSTALLSPANGQNQEPEADKVQRVIGKKTPLAKKCFENARDYSESYEALAPCNQSLEEEALTQRRRALVYANRGVIYFNLGSYEDAADDFTQSLNLGIHVRAKIYTNRGMSYEALGQDANAKRDYDAALAINPDYAIAKKRREELDKPIFERSLVIKRITAENRVPSSVGI